MHVLRGLSRRADARRGMGLSPSGCRLDNPRDDPDGHPGHPRRPLIVLGRHAGPGASFVLVHVLLRAAPPGAAHRAEGAVAPRPRARRPADAAGLRVHRPQRARRRGGDGGRPTSRGGPRPRRRPRHLPRGQRLDADAPPAGGRAPEDAGPAPSGRRRGGDAPRAPAPPGGTFAALQGAPDADIAVFMHTGPRRAAGRGLVWRALPLRRELAHGVVERAASGRDDLEALLCGSHPVGAQHRRLDRRAGDARRDRKHHGVHRLQCRGLRWRRARVGRSAHAESDANVHRDHEPEDREPESATEPATMPAARRPPRRRSARPRT